MGSAAREEWAVEGHQYSEGRSTAGLLYPSTHGNVSVIQFFPFHPLANGPVFFPNCMKIISSCKGLVLYLKNRERTLVTPYKRLFHYPYAIINPFSPPPHEPHNITAPKQVHSLSDPRVLLVLHEDLQTPVFHIVCAHRLGFLYNFHRYSSLRGKWECRHEDLDLGVITERTGIACGSTAYWIRRQRHTNMLSIISYSVETESHRIVNLPNTSASIDHLQLGRRGYDSLILYSAGRNYLAAHLLADANQQIWQPVFRLELSGFAEPLVPLRSESEEWQGLYYTDRRIIVCQGSPHATTNSLSFDGPLPTSASDFLPHVRSNLYPPAPAVAAHPPAPAQN